MAANRSTLQLWRLQFSLRSLLLAVTALAIVIPGGVSWWRRPFEIVEQTATSGWHHEAMLVFEGEPEKGRLARVNHHELPALPAHPYTQFAQVYRDLDGDLVRHGLVVTYDYKGRKLREERWRHGKLHGRWTDWDLAGNVIAYGEFLDGERHGSWVELKRFNSLALPISGTRITEYRHGVCISEAVQADGQLRLSLDPKGVPARRQVWNLNPFLLLDDVPYSSVDIFVGGERIAQPVPHGLVQSWHPTGELKEQITFEKGRRVGAVRGWHPDGELAFEGAFQDGLEHGRWTWYADGKVVRTAEFHKGRLAWRDGLPLPPLPLPEIGMGDPQAAAQLDKPMVPIVCNQAPLQQVIDYLGDVYDLGIMLSSAALQAVPPDTLVSHNASAVIGVQDSRALLLRSELQILLQPLELVPVIRHEMIVVTTPEDARTWRDRTGIPAIAASKTSGFAPKLRKWSRIEFNETMLKDAVEYLIQTHEIHIRIAPEAFDDIGELPCTLVARGTLAGALGALLEQYDLYCEDAGSELLIRPRTNGASQENGVR